MAPELANRRLSRHFAHTMARPHSPTQPPGAVLATDYLCTLSSARPVVGDNMLARAYFDFYTRVWEYGDLSAAS